MNVSTITMPREVAREQLREYRTALHRRADAEYQEVMLGLEELEKGTPLITLASVFATVPLDEKGRPKIAIARADRLRVRYANYWHTGMHTFEAAYDQRRGKAPRDSTINVPRTGPQQSNATGFAIVPLVPPKVRGTLDLTRHFTLWEVERWADHAREVGPDIDPLLLRRISSDLYAVVGSWDLSPLEQAILAGRRIS